MFDEKTPMTFPALLRTMEGAVLAEGLAHVREETHDVDFTSEFVPLFPLKTPLEVVRVEGKRVIHRFDGNVYLSSPTLLRLVSVSDSIPEDPNRYYCSDLPFKGTARLLSTEPPKGFLSFFKREPAQDLDDYFTVPIVSLSERRLVFLHDSKQPLYSGQKLVLTAHKPLLLPRVFAEITDAFWFGINASYTCRFWGLSESERKTLRYFLLEYSLRHREGKGSA